MSQHSHPRPAPHRHAPADACCTADTQAGACASPPRQTLPPDGADQVRYRIDKMDCPTEERLIRNRREPMAGVVRLDFNLLKRELTGMALT